MTTITLDIPDELAGRLAPVKNHLPQVLSFALDLLGLPGDEAIATQGISPLLMEIIDFLASGPSSTDIIAFKVSARAQARLEELANQNREEGLAPHEQAELSTYQQVNHLLILLKARARTTSASAN